VIFRRGSKTGDAADARTSEQRDSSDETLAENADGSGAAEAVEAVEEEATATAYDRSRGPWDVSEVEETDSRIDMGCLLIEGVPGLSLQVQVEENTQRVTTVTLVLEDAAVQVQAFAAPRSSGIWDEVREQISASISASGGLVETAEGEFGPELLAQVPGPNKALQPARFIGIDGPRWFLRGLFLGTAARGEGHPGLMDVFSRIVVVRGDEAMPSGEPLALTLPPADDATSPSDNADAPSDNPDV
jgi:hypothetical protein